jgi:hypothetical protein
MAFRDTIEGLVDDFMHGVLALVTAAPLVELVELERDLRHRPLASPCRPEPSAGSEAARLDNPPGDALLREHRQPLDAREIP